MWNELVKDGEVAIGNKEDTPNTSGTEDDDKQQNETPHPGNSSQLMESWTWGPQPGIA